MMAIGSALARPSDRSFDRSAVRTSAALDSRALSNDSVAEKLSDRQFSSALLLEVAILALEVLQVSNHLVDQICLFLSEDIHREHFEGEISTTFENDPNSKEEHLVAFSKTIASGPAQSSMHLCLAEFRGAESFEAEA